MTISGGRCSSHYAPRPLSPPSSGCSPVSLGAAPSFEARQVCGCVGRQFVTLRAPHRLGEALDRLVQRRVAIPETGEQRLPAAADSRRLVDRELLLEREVQAHVQERVCLIRVIFFAEARLIVEHRVVLRVLEDHVESCLHGAATNGMAEGEWQRLKEALDKFIR